MILILNTVRSEFISPFILVVDLCIRIGVLPSDCFNRRKASAARHVDLQVLDVAQLFFLFCVLANFVKFNEISFCGLKWAWDIRRVRLGVFLRVSVLVFWRRDVPFIYFIETYFSFINARNLSSAIFLLLFPIFINHMMLTCEVANTIAKDSTPI